MESIESWDKLTNSKKVDGGHRAIKFTRLAGVKDEVFNEGMHFVIPWFETPIVYDVRARPRNIASLTGTKGVCLFLMLF